MVDPRRLRNRNNQPVQAGPVLYWMQRDQRVQDNWALLYAAECAAVRAVPLLVVFNLVPQFGDTTARHYAFMFGGLREVETELGLLGIPFSLLQGEPTSTLGAFVALHNIGQVVTDFNPLRFTDEWRTRVGALLPVSLIEVDAHNIIPVWIASPKLEFAAYTLRPKIHRLLGEFLTAIPRLTAPSSQGGFTSSTIDWARLESSIPIDSTVPVVSWLTPGAPVAHRNLNIFCTERLPEYATKRNDPNENYLSHLSPYLHFGQLSAQRVALSVEASAVPADAKAVYLEELIVRRELADNYCFYNSAYDTLAGAHAWAQKSIAEHASDVREYIYTRTQFEAAETHDTLWNAAQLQMVTEGKMHGFMRMYWAKKILEWTPDAQTAIDTALYLNDKYELDGTDPNGIVGVMWSICGVHDRAWNARTVFGKIRYMNYNGCKRKFDVGSFEKKYTTRTESLFI